MDRPSDRTPNLLLLVAGAKGAIGTTLAAAVAAMQENPSLILSGLTTADKFPFLGDCSSVAMAGWDRSHDDIPAPSPTTAYCPRACGDPTKPVWRRYLFLMLLRQHSPLPTR